MSAGRTLREPGVYFSLPKQDYHDDAALGSTDMRKLADEPARFWWGSKFNPNWKAESPTRDQALGTAYHTMVLEGREAFEQQYAIKYQNWATNIGKAERAQMEASGKLPVGIDDWARIEIAGALVKANGHLAEAFVDGIPEVSIFWVANGIPKKCRIDYLKPRASVDLKTIANEQELPFPQACRNQIARYDYPTQAEHYREGRLALAQLVADGATYGDHDVKTLFRIAQTKAFAWVWVFLQKSSAPLTWGATLSPGNPLLKYSREARLDLAEAKWRHCMEQFGPNVPWIEPQPLAELSLEEMPLWYARDGVRL
jgi:hypothetical protein